MNKKTSERTRDAAETVQIDSDSVQQIDNSAVIQTTVVKDNDNMGYFNRKTTTPSHLQTSSVQQITLYEAQNRMFPQLPPEPSTIIQPGSVHFQEQPTTKTLLTPQLVQKQIAASFLKHGDSYMALESLIKVDTNEHKYREILHTILIKSVHKLEDLLLKSFKVKLEPLNRVNLRHIGLMNCKKWLPASQYLTFLKIVSINYSIQRESLHKDKSLSLYRTIVSKCQQYEAKEQVTRRRHSSDRNMVILRPRLCLMSSNSISDIERQLGELIVSMKYEEAVMRNTQARQKNGTTWQEIAITLAEQQVLRQALSKVNRISLQLAAKRNRPATPISEQQIDYLLCKELPEDIRNDLLRVHLQQLGTSALIGQLMGSIKKYLIENRQGSKNE